MKPRTAEAGPIKGRPSGPVPTTVQSLGLPMAIRACLFDLDGVLTQTARIHAAACKQTFDDFLRAKAAQGDGVFAPFDLVADYDAFVDGKPRYEGVRSFLASRGIEVREESIVGLGDRKNEIVQSLMRTRGVEPYAGSVRYLLAARAAGLHRKAGRFGVVVGVDRTGQADALREHGADLVVSDLADLLGEP